MTEDLLDYWLRMIKPLFPDNAWIQSHLSGGDHIIQIDWNLENVLHKQSTRSRKIEIIIKEEVIDNYLDQSRDIRVLYDIKMREWIAEHYHNFCLDQEAYPSNSTSPIKWRISKDVFYP